MFETITGRKASLTYWIRRGRDPRRSDITIGPIRASMKVPSGGSSATQRKVPARQSEPTLACPLFVDATPQDRYRPLDAALRVAVRRRRHACAHAAQLDKASSAACASLPLRGGRLGCLWGWGGCRATLGSRGGLCASAYAGCAILLMATTAAADITRIIMDRTDARREAG